MRKAFALAVVIALASTARADQLWNFSQDAQNVYRLKHLPTPGAGSDALRLQDVAVCAGIPWSIGVNGAFRCSVAGTDFPDPLATYLVASSSHIPTNGVNLGALSAGVLEQSVTAGVSTPTIFSATSQRVPFGSGTNGGLTDSAGFIFNGGSIQLLSAGIQQLGKQNGGLSVGTYDANSIFLFTNGVSRASLSSGGTFSVFSLASSLVKSDSGGALQNATVGTDYADPLATYLVASSSHIPTNGRNLGALGNGVIQQTVASGVATPNVFTASPGYVVFGSSSGGFGIAQDTNFYWDNGNKFLGIGTATPAVRLDILQTIAGVAGIQIRNLDAGTTSQVQNRTVNDIGSIAYYGIASSTFAGFAPLNSGQAFFGSSASPVSVFTQSANDIIFYTNAAEVARWKSGGGLQITQMAAPGTPAVSVLSVYHDSTSHNLAFKNQSGIVNHGIQSNAGASHKWVSAIADDGSVTLLQPTFADLGGSVPAYATIDANGSAVTQRSILNFSTTFGAVDNAGATRTDVTIATNAITNALIRQSGPSALVGNPTGFTANVTDIGLNAPLFFSGGNVILNYDGSSLVLSGGTTLVRAALIGDITAPAANNTTTLKNTGAGAGSCTYCSVSFDAQGRETTYSSGTTPLTSAFYQTVDEAATPLTQRNVLNFDGTVVAVDNVGATRTDVGLPNVGPGAGIRGGNGIASITLDAQGRVTTTTSATYLPDPGSNGIMVRFSIPPNNVVARSITSTGGSLTVTNGNGVSGNPSLDLVSQGGFTAGSFTNTNITVNQAGVITAITNGSGGSTFYQTVDVNGGALTQRPTLNFNTAFTVADNSGATRTDVSLVVPSSTQVPISDGTKLVGDSTFTYNTAGHTLSIGGSSSPILMNFTGTQNIVKSAGDLGIAVNGPNNLTLFTNSTQALLITSGQAIQIAALSAGGMVKAAVSTGQLGIATSGTDYVPGSAMGKVWDDSTDASNNSPDYLYNHLTSFTNSISFSPTGTNHNQVTFDVVPAVYTTSFTWNSAFVNSGTGLISNLGAFIIPSGNGGYVNSESNVELYAVSGGDLQHTVASQSGTSGMPMLRTVPKASTGGIFSCGVWYSNTTGSSSVLGLDLWKVSGSSSSSGNYTRLVHLSLSLGSGAFTPGPLTASAYTASLAAGDALFVVADRTDAVGGTAVVNLNFNCNAEIY